MSTLPPPRIAQLVLPDLRAGSKAELVTGADHDGVCWADLDLGDLQLTGSRFVDCSISRCRLDSTDLGSLRLISCRLDGLDVAVFASPRPTWREVELQGSRLGSAELFAGDWQSVQITDCRIGYLNCRQSQWRDVRFTRCRISELDLGGATVSRASFEDCDIESLIVPEARLTHVDLRSSNLVTVQGISGLAGATISLDQLLALAPEMASELGVHVGASSGDRPS